MKKNIFSQSLQELRYTKVLALCAILGALKVILGYIATINVGPYVKIGFSGLPGQIVAYLFGPITAMLYGGIMDIVGYVARPDGPFYPGFTLNAILGMFIYGCFLYKKDCTLIRVFAAKFTVMLICNVIFNTLLLSMLYGKGFMAILPMRALKNLIMWPIDSLILYLIIFKLKEIPYLKSFFAKDMISKGTI